MFENNVNVLCKQNEKSLETFNSKNDFVILTSCLLILRFVLFQLRAARLLFANTTSFSITCTDERKILIFCIDHHNLHEERKTPLTCRELWNI